MNFKEGQRLIAVANGVDFGKPNASYSWTEQIHDYAVGWKGTMGDNNVITFDNGRAIRGCDHRSFDELKEETKMIKGDKVKVSGCTGCKEKFNGKTGEYIEKVEDLSLAHHRICFDDTGKSCGYIFTDNELTVVPKATVLGVGSKVTCVDGSYSMEFTDGTLKDTGDMREHIYEITEMGLRLPASILFSPQTNDTIIRRISDGKVFFVQQRFLKEFVAVPKFKRGDWVQYDNGYYKVVSSKTKDSEVSYKVTQIPQVYDENDGKFGVTAKESELSEVAQ